MLLRGPGDLADLGSDDAIAVAVASLLGPHSLLTVVVRRYGGWMRPNRDSDRGESQLAVGVSGGDRVAVLSSAELPEALRLLQRVYARDPRFAKLFGLEHPADTLRAAFLFRGVCRSAAQIPGTGIGYSRDGRLIGVLVFTPRIEVRWWVFLSHPVLGLRLAWQGMGSWWEGIRKLPRSARNRWRAYCRLAVHCSPPKKSLQVNAIGVCESARRSGVARALLNAVDHHKVWGEWGSQIAVNTWTQEKVKIYERLGFTQHRYEAANGVECWTLLRAVAKAESK